MSQWLAALLSLMVACTFASAQHEETIVRVPEVGFQLTIPAVDWGHRVERDNGGLNAVIIGPDPSNVVVRLSIQVSAVLAVATETASTDVRQVVESIAKMTDISEVEAIELELAGHKAPGLRLIQKAKGEEFRVHLMFMHSRGIRYRVQFHAPRDQFAKHWKTAEKILAGFELIELDPEANEQWRLGQLAARCGSQIDWAADWEEASKRAREQGRLIVVAVHAQPGFVVGNQLNQRVFMSREIISLMDHRFIGWRWSAGQRAPFVDHNVFGLSGSTFGVGLLVCTPDGQVVRQVFLLDPDLVADALRGALRDHPKLAPPPPPPPKAASLAETVAFLIDSGQLERAHALLGEPKGDEPGVLAFQRTRLSRIERRGSAALTALQVAKERVDPSFEFALPLEEARIRIGMGQNGIAEDVLRRSLAGNPEASYRAEAKSLLGILSLAVGATERARDEWTALTRELPEQPAAWTAAAALLGPALKIELQPDLRWPTEAEARVAIIPDPAPMVTPLKLAPALSGAVEWLAAAQRTDGGWDVPFGMGDLHSAPGAIEMAIQAIATCALIRTADMWQQDRPDQAQRCREAARRGLQRYLADRQLGRLHPRPVAFMDYTCWGSSYGLLCVSAALDSNLGFVDTMTDEQRAQLRDEAARLIEDLVRVQADNGGWSYYISGKVGGQAVGASMSFTTATVLLSLHAALDLGLDVPRDVINRGSACLASMRGTNGIWEYMRVGPGPHAAGVVDASGAAARSPVCTLAMLRLGLVPTSAMTSAFESYIEHLDGFSAEARKALMHAGASGQGSHYLLYDYSTAAEALHAVDSDALDAATRKRARSAISRGLAHCRNADGSFVDNPIIGCAAGTGLAALTLLDLLQDPAINKD